MSSSSSLEDELSLIFYYGRKGYFGQLEKICDSLLLSSSTTASQKKHNLYSFWKSFSLMMDQRINEAMREFTDLSEKTDLALASIVCLIHCCANGKQQQSNSFREELEAKRAIADASASNQSLLLAAMANLLLVSSKNYEEIQVLAKRIISKGYNGINSDGSMSSTMDNTNSKSLISETSVMAFAHAILGWTYLGLGSMNLAEESFATASTVFASNRTSSIRFLESFMGRISMLQPDQALQECHLAVTYFPNFTPALVEQMMLFLKTGQWDQSVRIANKMISNSSKLSSMGTTSSSNIVEICTLEAHCILALHELVKIGNPKKAIDLIQTAFTLITAKEPRNHTIILEFEKSLARNCAQNSTILNACLNALLSYRNDSKLVLLEIAFLQTILGNSEAAIIQYQKLLNDAAIDNRFSHSQIKSESLLGLSWNFILQGRHEDAEKQLELLKEITDEPSDKAMLQYLEAQIIMAKYMDERGALDHLEQAIDLQLGFSKGNPQITFSYYAKLNSDFMLLLGNRLEGYLPIEPSPESFKKSSSTGGKKRPEERALSLAQSMFETIHRTVPGSLEALYHTAKLKFLINDFTDALLIADQILAIDPVFLKAHLLQAQTLFYQKNYKKSLQALDAALSANFAVRKLPLYALIRGRVLKALGELKEAMILLEEIYSPNHQNESFLSSQETLIASLELAKIQQLLGNQMQALHIIQDTVKRFKDPVSQSKLLLAQVDLLISGSKDFDAALSLLYTVTPKQEHFVEARKLMAQIYLQEKKNVPEYKRCFRELVDLAPSLETYILLGDSYLELHETDQAINVYKKALSLFPQATNLSSKIARAMIQMHEYAKAVEYFEDALGTTGDSNLDSPLCLDLAQLYYNLDQRDACISLIEKAISKSLETDDVTLLQRNIDLLRLKAKVLVAKDAKGDAIEAMKKARNLADRRKDIRSLRLVWGDISLDLGNFYLSQSDTNNGEKEAATEFLSDALLVNPSDRKVLLCLIKLNIKMRDFNGAIGHCTKLLHMDPQQPDYLYQMAEILFEAERFEDCLKQLEKLLDLNPTYENGLSLYIQLLWRTAKLFDETINPLTLNNNSNNNSNSNKSYLSFLISSDSYSHRNHFSRGLYFRYSNDTSKALQAFNEARKDPNWRERAIYQMVEIFLNPDNETIGANKEDEIVNAATSNAESTAYNAEQQKFLQDSEMLSSLMAEKLLKELSNGFGDYNKSKVTLYTLESMINSKQKEMMENAVEKLTLIVKTNPKDPHALLILCQGHLLLSQPAKAKALLKGSILLGTAPSSCWNGQDGTFLERLWLLAADLYLQSGKTDSAVELLQRVLRYNASCTKAYDYLGLIKEKEADFKGAAENYEKSWRFEQQSNPSTGYKLAFVYLKAKRYFDSIDVCHVILSRYPQYPKIKREIMDKARSCIKI